MRVESSPPADLRSRESWRSMVAGSHYLVGNSGELAPSSAHGTVVIPTLNQIFFWPVLTGRGGIITNAAFEVTAGAVGAVGRIGIYRGNLGTPPVYNPGSLLFDSGSLNCAAAGMQIVAVPNLVMEPDAIWWIATLFGTAAPTIRTVDAGALMGYQGTTDMNTLRTGCFRAFAFAAFPDPAGALGGFLLNQVTHAAGINVV